MHELTDEDLMNLFCFGKTEAFQVLYDKYKNRIFSFVHACYGRNIADAEEYTQEIFLKMIVNRQMFNPAMRFSTWFYTIARNYCLNKIRTEKIQCVISLDEVDESQINQSGHSADKLMLDGELGVEIRQAISALPENLRTVFVMREIEELSHTEIAEILNLNEGNVRTQLFRAKKQLQELLTPYLGGENERK